MKVRDLIGLLSKIDENKEVEIFYDGAPRGDVHGLVYVGGGVSIVANHNEFEYQNFKEKDILYQYYPDY